MIALQKIQDAADVAEVARAAAEVAEAAWEALQTAEATREEVAECGAQTLHDHTLEALEIENAALRETIRAMQSEYICACGIRVTPHKCPADNGF